MSSPISDERYALTAVQQGMLFHRVQAPASGVDIEQMIATLREPIDRVRLESAWQIVCELHGALRTRVIWEGLRSPVQEVLPRLEVRLEERDLSARSEHEQQALLSEFLHEDRVRGIDLSNPPLFRVRLFRFGVADYRLVWTFPHLLLDGGSFPIVVRDVFTAYDALCRSELPELSRPTPYAEHVAWLEQEVRNKAEPAAQYFRGLLAGFSAKNELCPPLLQEAIPASRARPPARGAALYGQAEVQLSMERTGKLRELSRQQGVTLNTCVQAAWSLVIADFSREADVVFGVVRACRRTALPEAERMVGLFINTLPMRVAITPERPLLDWLSEIRAAYVAARRFEHTPLLAAQAVSEVASGSPLFDSIIVFNDMSMNSAMKASGDAYALRDFDWIEQTNFPLTLFGYGEPALLLKLAYDPERVDDARASAMVDRLEATLCAMADQPEGRLGDLSRVPQREATTLAAWNANQLRFESDRCVHELFDAQVARTPAATALVFRDQALTYCELSERSNRVARRLVQLGVAPGSLVGVFCERSLTMVVGLLGILKAGAAYVPLDPAYPSERVALMIEDSGAQLVVTTKASLERLPSQRARPLLLDDDLLLHDDASAPPVVVTSKDLAYVIFTSGSTGRPKGVMVEHRNVVNFFTGMDQRIGPKPGTWLAVTSISFDISVLELFWTLARGFKVVLQEEGDKAGLSRKAKLQAPLRKVEFSLFYFAADAAEGPGDRYRLLLDGAKYADTHGFSAVWTPERHFHAFGGLYPNPALTSAALATITENVQLRAGSVVLPLHDPLRVAEEWSVVDNLSNGRVGLSFASGWHVNDFVLKPENYATRKEVTLRNIETVKRLWRGESISAKNGNGEDIQVAVLPRPVQENPPMWLTAATSVDSFKLAGELGMNVLTNMLGQSVEELGEKLRAYRAARQEHGHAGEGHVSLMLHTLIGESVDSVRELVREPFSAYLKTSTDLVKKARWQFPAFARPGQPGHGEMAQVDLTPEEEDALMAHAFERYFKTNGLFGTPESCLEMMRSLSDVGVNEVACLIDFGVRSKTVLHHLQHLNRLRELCAIGANAEDEFSSIPAQIRRHQVTHLQCTPSLARLLLEDPDALSALGSLRRLMLGGEALPSTLAHKLTAALADGQLLNMYGPTETTVWSTTALVESGAPISVGRPFANTTIQILDAQLKPAPLGIAGELCIGGAGVTRGYLGRPELTQERFIPDPYSAPWFAGEVARLYRTGDLARFLADGRLDFIGRMDHQVKLRGYRIELGEIESVLAKHAAVAQVVVVVREDTPGDQRLVAYLVPRGGGSLTDAAPPAQDRGQEWQKIWDEAYRGEIPDAQGDPAFNTSGWNSSYTGEPISSVEMGQWLDHTIARIQALGARRLLEVGCGTGLLLFRLAPGCERYVAVDFSQVALDNIARGLAARALSSVELVRAGADELSFAPNSFDVAVLNSVAQYFPSADYLVAALDRMLATLAPGGKLFVGDVRSRPLVPAFHTSVEMALSPDSITRGELLSRIERRATTDRELTIAPEFFEAFVATRPELELLRNEPKRGLLRNELQNYRADVVIRKRSAVPEAGTLAASRIATVVARELSDVPALRERLAQGHVALHVVGLENPRVARDFAALALLRSDSGPKDLQALRVELAGLATSPWEPEVLYTLDAAYDVELVWSEDARSFDAWFVHREQAQGERRPRVSRALSDELASYTQRAQDKPSSAELGAQLRGFLREKLPDFMVPSAFVQLEALPLTQNGKIDRKALPAPEASSVRREQAFEPPNSDLERAIAATWQELLHLEQVGLHDNFFELGANSLLTMQANGRLRSSLNKSISLVEMFQFPTVASLAKHLIARDGAQAPLPAANAGVDRAQARRDAMLRRAGAARGLKP
jgi:natural product biosynthesis luciferase-like monooxygenase protein